MDFLKKIRQKIDEFCFNHMRMDGAQHLIAGILIYDVLKYLIPVWSAILITLIILISKEVVLDKWIKKGAADWHDIIWGGHRAFVRSAVSTTLRLNDTVSNSDVAHRILVYTVTDTELNALNCVECLVDFDKVIVKMKLIKKIIISLHIGNKL